MDTLNFSAPSSPWEIKAADALRSRDRYAIRNYILTLDPERDCQEISYLFTGFYVWREIGKRMGIRDLPTSYEAFEQFNRDFEHKHFHYSPDNEIIATATRNLFLSWMLPRWLYSVGAPFVHALIDDQLLAAVGLKPAPHWLQSMVHGSIGLRGRLVRLLPPRRHPHLITRKRTPTYPNGYQIGELGANQ